MSHSPIPMYDPVEWEVLCDLAEDPTPPPQLPTKVWERILDQLDVSDWWDDEERGQTFAVCCSICRVWLPRSRYHLFKTVRVQSKEHVKQVSKLLRSNPVLRTRVEGLTVCGSEDAKKDASWIGLVGFHLGPKLKALEKITLKLVNFSLIKFDSYELWGALNKAWKPGVERKIDFYHCKVTHINQLARLAFVTKAGELKAEELRPPDKQVGPALPVPALPSGTSLSLRSLRIYRCPPELMSPGPCHTLAKRCPLLSTVDIDCRNRIFLQQPDDGPFLVSIFDMFRRMQRHNDTNHVTLSAFASFPSVEMMTRPDYTNIDNTPPSARPHLRRELVIDNGYFGVFMERLAYILTCFEDSMSPGTTTVNRGFHHIKLSRTPAENISPFFSDSLDTILSRLRVAAPDVHLVVEGRDRPQNGCVLPQMRKYFPKFCQLAPRAFCHPDGGQPCVSHLDQAGEYDRGQEAEVGGAEEEVTGEQDKELYDTHGDTYDTEVEMYEAAEEMEEEQFSEIEEEEEFYATTATGKRNTTEGLEVVEDRSRGKRRRTE